MNVIGGIKNYLLGLILLTIVAFVTKAIFYISNYFQGYFSIPLLDGLYALTWGLRFDISVATTITLLIFIVVYLCVRVRLFKAWRLSPYFVGPAVLLGVQVGDWLYFLDANRHVSYEIRDMVSDPVELLLTAIGKHSGIFIIAIFCIVGLLYAGLKLWKKETCLKNKISIFYRLD